MSKININNISLLLITLLCIISCEWEQREEIKVDDLPDPISFNEHIIPIFDNNCIKCHNGSVPPDLSSDNVYLNLVGGGFISVDEPNNSKLYEAIDVNGSMYQYATDLNRAFILKWIEEGANDN